MCGSGMSCDEDVDLHSWGWNDLCVSSSGSSAQCVYLGQPCVRDYRDCGVIRHSCGKNMILVATRRS